MGREKSLSVSSQSGVPRPAHICRLIIYICGVLFLVRVINILFPESTYYRPLELFYPGEKCQPIPGLEDVMVVVRTGASESQQRIPVHLKTHLRCVPHFRIYSDFEEDIDGHHIYDGLSTVNTSIKQSVPEFRPYQRLHELGRRALIEDSFAKHNVEKEHGDGKLENHWWKLDKWKFLPLVDMALEHKPDAKWYVFMEADTYIVWRNMAAWLSRFDPSKPHYMGYWTMIGDMTFAHGGSGFVVSNPAMKLLSEDRKKNLNVYDQKTAVEWAGDAVLGWALEKLGVPLIPAWPNLQGKPSHEIDYTELSETGESRLWCYRALSYHHMLPEDMRSVYEFETRKWKETSPLTHAHVFTHFILPGIKRTPIRDNWDNLSDRPTISGQNKRVITSFEACRNACKEQKDCMQYSYSTNSCKTFAGLSLGKSVVANSKEKAIHSGWMLDRIDNFVRNSAPCNTEGWTPLSDPS